MDGGAGDSSHQQQHHKQQHQQHHQQQQQQQQQWLAMQQYQQQWMAMQMQYPPAAAMVMQQQQMMYGGQQYVPAAAAAYYPQHQLYQQHQQQQPQLQQQLQKQAQAQIQEVSEENRTIWIGDLQQWMDEPYLQSCFAQSGELVSIKVIRNKQTGQSERYGFVEFGSHATAEKVLQSYTSTTMPNTEQPFRLNWAAFSMGNKRLDAGSGSGAGAGAGATAGSDLSIFVGDLAIDVTDTLLHETFASRYPSVKGAKVVVDTNTGRSKGYGFVRFGDEDERTRAITEMNGAYCSSRQMRIGVATPKKPSAQQQYSSQAVILAGGYPSNGVAPQGSDGDSSNTTIFVGGLDSDVSDEELRQTFAEFGEVVSVKIPPGKGCGFVQFSIRSSAEEAIQRLNGAVIGKQTVRLSWGRTPVNRQYKMDSGNQWNGAGYGRQCYNGYGYGMPQNQDSVMYAAVVANGASSNGHVNQ